MKSLTDLDRARLRWRARRGLLENDLIITKFLDEYELTLTDEDVTALSKLFLMDDHQLLDVLLARVDLPSEYNTPDISRLVALMQEM